MEGYQLRCGSKTRSGTFLVSVVDVHSTPYSYLWILWKRIQTKPEKQEQKQNKHISISTKDEGKT